MLNHVSIMGRIVADIDLKQTPSGVDFCKFRIACDRDETNGHFTAAAKDIVCN